MLRLAFIPGWAIPPGPYAPLTESLSTSCSVSVADYGFFSGKCAFDFHNASFENFALPDEPFVLCAHSMGTLPALKYAADAASRVKALVLLSPFARFTADVEYEGHEPGKLEAMKRRLARDPVKMLGAFYKSLSPNSGFALETPRELNIEALSAGLDFLRNSDFRNLLDSITAPSLIIQGTDDAVTKKQMADYMASKLKNCTCHIIQGAGHSIPIESGPECVGTIRNFLSSME